MDLALQVMPTAESVSDRFLDVRAQLERISNEDPEFGKLLSQSLEVVGQALDLFGSSGLAISFNGGKDACVVFYLLLLVLAERNQVNVLCTFHSKVGVKENSSVLKLFNPFGDHVFKRTL